jgi:type II secretory pathway predicted ATPase ExeA/cell division septation protein DedD
MHPVNDESARPFVDASAPSGGPSPSLTYEPFYRLREKAFSLSADPRFLFRSPSHAPAFDALLAGIRRREGLLALTGEIGTGKTTLCRSVLQHLDRRTFSAFVPDPFASREDLLKMLLVDFGVISIADLTRGRFNGASRSDLSYPLYEFLDSLVPLQAFAVLVIDEAQNLSFPLLEEIRILSELERREKLLQVVLIGQPELRASLKLPQMRQVEQRVSVHCELNALDAEATAGYVNHRLGVAGGGKGVAEFTEDALEAVHQGSSGVPRLINRICDRALERAYSRRSLRIDAHFVWDAIDDLGLRPSPGVHDVTADEPPAPPVSVERPIVETPIQVTAPPPEQVPEPQPEPIAAVTLPSEAPLAVFEREAEPPVVPPVSTTRSSSRNVWAAGLVASFLAFSAFLGVAVWYLQTQTVLANVDAPSLPPRPKPASAETPVTPPVINPALAEAPQNSSAVPAAKPAPVDVNGEYTIMVASFESRDRAESLVAELRSAGYRARAFERDWGPPRGRLVHVTVGGYASAIEVQRDLQQIRELPGGYTDARIVER